MRIDRWPNVDPLVGEMTDDQRVERFRLVRDRIKLQAETWVKAQKDAETGVFSRKLSMAVGH
jgi:hypothetical protein